MKMLVLLELAFLFGSIPSVRLVERIWSTDLSTVGTGNAGAGNATRSVGAVAGVSLAVLDGLKGLIPVLAATWFELSAMSIAAIGLAAVAGNNWPVWRKDRGGRGLATSVGVVLAASPGLILWPALWSAAGWRIGGALGGFLGWGVLPVYVAFVDPSTANIVLAAGLAVFMLTRRAQGNAGFATKGLVERLVFDVDGRTRTRPARPLAHSGPGGWAAALLLVGLPGYVLATLSLSTEVRIGAWGLVLLGGAALTEVAAKFAFGELFREGTVRSGVPVSRLGAFRAALVGTGVARLIPVGGAITPVAMAWSVRGEREGTSGAALRATVLNYGALLGATGIGLLWAAVSQPPTRAPGTIVAVGVLLLVGGLAVIGFGGRLRRLLRLVPARFRSRVEPMLIDCDLTARAWSLLAARVVLEAATLGLTLRAFGSPLPPSQVVAAFGGSQLVGGLPGAPGGLGVTETGLVGFLVLFGIPVAAAAAPVFAFRMISYWLPALGGVAAGGSVYLRTHSKVDSRPAT